MRQNFSPLQALFPRTQRANDELRLLIAFAVINDFSFSCSCRVFFYEGFAQTFHIFTIPWVAQKRWKLFVLRCNSSDV